jgi:hypothetical protein
VVLLIPYGASSKGASASAASAQITASAHHCDSSIIAIHLFGSKGVIYLFAPIYIEACNIIKLLCFRTLFISLFLI